VLEKSQKYLEFCERVSEQSDLLHSKRGGRVSPSALVFVGGMGQLVRVRGVILAPSYDGATPRPVE